MQKGLQIVMEDMYCGEVTHGFHRGFGTKINLFLNSTPS